MRRFWALIAVAAAAFAADPAAAPARTGPSLVVVIVVDQLPAGTLERRRELLTGGLARLLAEGRSFTRCAHDHALTETAPGHAALISGLSPRDNGIILNEWFDAASHREVYCVGDEGPGGKPNFDDPVSSPVSPDHLKGETLSDLLKRSDPLSKVFSVSGKDRSAIIAGGHHPDGAFWYSRASGGFTSNPSLVGSLPSYGEDFWGNTAASRKFLASHMPEQWTYPQRRAAAADDDPHERDLYSRVAPHPVLAAGWGSPGPHEWHKGMGDQVFSSPWVDWLTLALGRRILEAESLGGDEHPDLLVVALSGADSIGHLYGPESQEYLDELIRLDAWLGEFMTAAEKSARRAGGVLFALSSDHGVLPLPERVAGARRIDKAALLKRIEAALQERFGAAAQGPFIAGEQSGHLYLDRAKLAALGMTPDEAAEQAKGALAGFPELARVYTAAELTAAPPTVQDPFLRLYRASYDAQRGGDLIVQPCEKCVYGTRPEGTTHGSPYEYDRGVPMILMGRGIDPGADASQCRTVDLAPTIAGLLGLDFETPRDGAPLTLRKVDSGARRK
ncbi:MAG TPA: alkaline phosphatase family protein [Candidatus Polarisedimenticolia bacterium]|nr:alkaline phosphatase family protein [Candidatus Polarisedimenticolia bacterium]